MRTAALMLLLLAAMLAGCSSDDDDTGSGTVEVVVTDKATGEPAADVEAERASRIKTHIDSSDVVRLFPPSIVLDGDVKEQETGTPQRALLEWWQAFQFRDVKTVLALTSRETLKTIGRRNLIDLVRRTGLQGIEILDATTDGDTALIQAGLLNFAAPRGEPPPRKPTASLPATFTMVRESGEWVYAQTDYLVPKVENLKKRG
jgi:hypothetical protein